MERKKKIHAHTFFEEFCIKFLHVFPFKFYFSEFQILRVELSIFRYTHKAWRSHSLKKAYKHLNPYSFFQSDWLCLVITEVTYQAF